MTRLKKDGTPALKPGRKPNPNKPVKIKTGRTGPRPHVWKCGSDEFKHSLYTPWMKAKAQANFRNEDWQLDFEDFYLMWKDHWHLRGRDSTSYCMTRLDFCGIWNKTNTVIMTRKEHLVRNAGYLKGQRGSTGIYYTPTGNPRGRPSKPVDPNAPIKKKRVYVKKTDQVVFKKMRVTK
jgi:hypothetical protein